MFLALGDLSELGFETFIQIKFKFSDHVFVHSDHGAKHCTQLLVALRS